MYEQVSRAETEKKDKTHHFLKKVKKILLPNILAEVMKESLHALKVSFGYLK